jgi:hypothetical protein
MLQFSCVEHQGSVYHFWMDRPLFNCTIERDGNLKVKDHHHIQGSNGQQKIQATTKEKERSSILKNLKANSISK